jgi:uncharacterized protein YbjT (DUF2867 family)
VILLCGGTGDLGGRIARLLHQGGRSFRALVRPQTDGSGLAALGEVVRGDLRSPESLPPALDRVVTVVTTANAMGRKLAGQKDISFDEVDLGGNANLIAAAETSEVSRFVFVSMAGLTPTATSLSPFAMAKWQTEERLRASPMETVVVRPDMFQEFHLSPAAGFDWPNGKVRIFGKGDAKAAYVALDDVAEAVVRLALAEEPPGLVEFGGPEKLTRNEAADLFERATGRSMRRSHVPRAVLRAGALVMRSIRPEMGSLMGMAYAADLEDATWSDEPLREMGIEPRSASVYIDEVTRVGLPEP